MNNLKLFFAPGNDLSVASLNKCQFIKLLHPRTGKKTVFLWSTLDERLFNVQRIEFPKRSLFVDNYIAKSGHVYVCSEIDLILIFLPALIETVKFTTTDGLLRLQSAPGLPHFFTETSLARLQRVCDKKSVGSHNVVRLNKDKLKIRQRTLHSR
uniref:Ribonuclease H2 subunit B n=1 Tax=Schistocephalus solidus TaxID=70667 RepID=A0A0X3PY16_SCHSO